MNRSPRGTVRERERAFQAKGTCTKAQSKPLLGASRMVSGCWRVTGRGEGASRSPRGSRAPRVVLAERCPLELPLQVRE